MLSQAGNSELARPKQQTLQNHIINQPRFVDVGRDEPHVTAWCTGKDMFVGVPAILGANGVEKIIELKLTADELGQLKKSADHVLEKVKRLNL